MLPKEWRIYAMAWTFFESNQFVYTQQLKVNTILCVLLINYSIKIRHSDKLSVS